MNALNVKAFASLPVLILVMAALIFIPAASFHYWQAWVFLAVYFVSSFAITVYLMKRNPELLRRRMRGGPAAEKQTTQKIIMSLASLGFVALLVVPALDHRWGLSHVPRPTVFTGDLLVALGFLGVLRVFRENSYTSSTVELAAGQQVIATGPYALIRHPMYAAALGMLAGVPIALGSYFGLIAFASLSGIVIWRLVDEEKFLAANLPGYPDYQKAVRYRLIPGIW
jgi:protein-S-isoprenylcysteine O-methyltransferase Ste14